MTGILLKFAKYIILAMVLYSIALIFSTLIIELVYPILPESVTKKIDSSLVVGSMLGINKDRSVWRVISELFILSSFFVISWKLFRRRNIITKIIFGACLLWGSTLLCSFLKNDILTSILMGVPSIISLILIGINISKKFNRKKESTIEVFSKTKKDINGFVFKTSLGYIHLENPFRGIYIQGGAGSGKSVSVFEPIIEQIAKQQYTGLLYDFKSPELTKKILKVYQGQTNIETYFIDFKNPNTSNRVNPIEPKYLQKTAYALEYSTVLINNLLPETVKKMDFWSNNAKMVLAGTIWYLKKKYPQYCSLPHVISILLQTDINKLINEISADYEAGGMVASLKQAIDRDAEKQVAGVLSTIQNGLSLLNTPDMFWILSGNDIDLHLNNPNQPKFLCLGNDPTLSSSYAPVISLIISVSIRLMNQPNQQKSIVLLDEAPTIYIPNIEQMPATARSNKVATVFGVQDYSQLVDKYGESKAQVILSNLGNQFYGRTVNVKSAEMIKNLFGKQDKTYQTNSKGAGTSGQFIHLSSNENKGISESIQERDRVKVSDVTNMGAGQFYGLIAEGQPKEFLKVQFLPNEIKSNHEFITRTTDQQMQENYLRIVEEAKSIII